MSEDSIPYRKERSRDAARSRRGKENYEFYELAKMLPLPGAITTQLDKASIVRLTISYLKLRNFSSHGDPPWTRDSTPPTRSGDGRLSGKSESFEASQGTHILQSLDGFAFALTNDGRFLYISETVSIYLGLSQVEMAGSTIFDYVHSGDHQELADYLGLSVPQPGSSSADDGTSNTAAPRTTPPIQDRVTVMNPNLTRGYDRSCCIRMKSTLTKRGVHVKCSGYRVVHILLHMRPQFSFSMSRKHPPQLLGLVGIALALPPPTINEMRMEADMFVMRLNVDFTVSYCESRLSDLMDLSADDLVGKTFYGFCHAEDLKKLQKSHSDLIMKGQVLTDYYRLMNQHGGYVWIQTCASLIINKNQEEIQTIVAINYVLSGIEYGTCIMDCNQLLLQSSNEPDQSDNSEEDCSRDTISDTNNNTGCDSTNKSNDQSTAERRYKQYGRRSHDMGNLALVENEYKQTDKSTSDNVDQYECIDDTAIATTPTTVSTESTLVSDAIVSDMSLISHYSIPPGGDTIAPSTDCSDQVIVDSSVQRGQKRKHCEDDENPCEVQITHSPVTHVTSPMTPVTHSPMIHVTSPMTSATSTMTVTPASPHNVPHTPSPEDLSTRSHDQQDDTQMTSSVRVLEEAMNRHLPTDSNCLDDLTHLGIYSLPNQKSAIQWIGSQQQSASLPASNLLRHLYASRESVIRTNIYQPRAQYYGNTPSSMLTPPGEQIALPQLATSSQFQTSTTFSPTEVVPQEHYNMTPPGSVSPHDKYHQSPFDQAYAEAAAQFRHISTDPESTIKFPAVYSVPTGQYQGSYYNYPGFTQSSNQFR